MDELIINLTDEKLKKFLQNIRGEHLCLLMTMLGVKAKNKILNTMSDNAKNTLLADVKRYKDHLKAIKL